MNPAKHAPQAPRTLRVPTIRTHHGDSFTDDYEWLRDTASDEVLTHLSAENAYADAVTLHQAPLRETIFQEIKARTVETDLSVPVRRRGWWYFTRTSEGSQYAVQCRVAASDTSDPAGDWTPPAIAAGVPIEGEEVLLDGNAEAAGKPFFSLGGMVVSEDGTLLAYAQDNAGDERFTLRIKNLTTQQLLPDVIENVFYGLAFSPDGTRIFYTVVDDSWRPHQIRRHTLGSDPQTDVVVFQEDDPGMWLGFDLSPDRTELLLVIGNSEYSETLILDLNDENGLPVMLISREHCMLHSVTPVILETGRAYVITHDRDALNNMVSLLRADQMALPYAQQRWETIIEHHSTVKVEDTAATATHLIVAMRKDTTERLAVLPLAGLGTNAQPDAVEPAFDEQLHTVSLASAEFEAPMIRLAYTSDVTPARIYDLMLADGTLILRKQAPVNNYDPSNYLATQEWAEAADGTMIPLTILRRADLTNDSPHPVLIYGYGSYEASRDPGFSIPRLSLLDRGVVMVTAHVRGGGEMGRQWYLDGKKLAKKNTFTDFVDATAHLVTTGWADPARIVAMGGSAGGLLMGAVANLAPQLYAGIVAQVPFVDALTSILDPDLPLSALEWEEWGNPIKDAAVYEYMKSYSPYENIAALPYPRIAAVTSLHDTRVLCVEPAKWVAKLREETTGDEPIIMKVEMDGGHGGASGRYEGWKTRSWDFAFVLDALGLNPAQP